MKSIIQLIIITLIFSSCSTNKSIVGLYGKCNKINKNCAQIELKENKTFEYYIFIDINKEKVTKGTWERISDTTLELNIIEQFKNINATDKRKEKNKSTDTIKNSEYIILPIPHLTDKKVSIKKRKLIFNGNKHWSTYSLKKTRMKNKQWN